MTGDDNKRDDQNLSQPPVLTSDDVKVHSDALVYDGFFKLRTYEVSHKLMKGGWSKKVSRECFMRPPSVAILPYDPYTDKIVLIEQFRIGCLDALEGPFPMELVAGIVDPGENPDDTAYRECLEESGTEAMVLEFICDYRVSPGGSNEKVRLYCGGIDSSGVGGNHGLAEEGEDIWVQLYSREEAWNAFEEGYISDANTIIALQWLQANYQRLQTQWQ